MKAEGRRQKAEGRRMRKDNVLIQFRFNSESEWCYTQFK